MYFARTFAIRRDGIGRACCGNGGVCTIPGEQPLTFFPWLALQQHGLLRLLEATADLDLAGYNQVFEAELERLRQSVSDAEVKAKLESLKDLDWSGYIARELRKAGFRGDELEEFVHEIVVKLLVAPGKLFTGWNPRHHGPLDRRFGASVRNQILNIVSKRANRRRYLPSVSIGNDEDGVPEDFLPSTWDDRSAADFRDLLAQRLGPLAVALFDAKMRGEDMASLVGDPNLGSPTMYKLKSMVRGLRLVEKDR